MPKEARRYMVRSVSRALELLKLFSVMEPELSLMQISERLRLSPSTAFRLLATLEAEGYVEHRENRKYHLGLTCLELGSIFLKQNDIRQQALPILRGLRDECKETVHLAVLSGTEVVYLEKLDALLSIGFLGSHVGARAPAHCTALGKAMLAYKPENEVRQLYTGSRLNRHTPNTITDLEALLIELARTKARGFAVDNEEHEAGVKCVAVAVLDSSQLALGAISISGPAARMEQCLVKPALIDRLREAGHAIASRSG
jgi:DNA-binding IclR family transcriptional regulator